MLALYQQGEISYFKIVVDTVFKMSGMAEESLKSFIKEFSNKGLAKILMRTSVSFHSKLMEWLSGLQTLTCCVQSLLFSMSRDLLSAWCLCSEISSLTSQPIQLDQESKGPLC